MPLNLIGGNLRNLRRKNSLWILIHDNQWTGGLVLKGCLSADYADSHRFRSKNPSCLICGKMRNLRMLKDFYE